MQSKQQLARQQGVKQAFLSNFLHNSQTKEGGKLVVIPESYC